MSSNQKELPSMLVASLRQHSTASGIPGLRRCAVLVNLASLLFLAPAANAAAPSPEKLLPPDTLLLLTAPSFSELSDGARKLPFSKLWNDPAMKPFRDNFDSRFRDDFLKPLERELDIKFADYTGLLQGQLTLALIQNGGAGDDPPQVGKLLLADTREKSPRLNKNLAELRKKWLDAGRPMRTEKIREFEFTVLSMGSNEVPKTLRQFFSPSSEVQELGDETTAKKAAPKPEFVLGQVDSLLVLGNSVKAVEKVVVRLRESGVPTLGELAAYQASHLALFRRAPLYAWVNAKAWLDILDRPAAEKKENPEAPNPFDAKPDKLLKAMGFSSLKTVALSYQNSDEGPLLQLFFGAPEATRQGLFKLIAGEPKESNPPAFVPGDAVKFWRWRLNGQKSWATLEKILNDISPQALNGINFLLETAEKAAQEKDPGFDIRKGLIGNLGDDLISYEKAPRGAAPANLKSPPSLVLLGSPNAEQLAAAFKTVLVFMSQQPGAPPEEREFLGRKIFSVPITPMPLPLSAAGSATPKTLHYAASAGYLALSTDTAMLEEYLRSMEGRGKPLRDIAGLGGAAQEVIGPASSLFGYENQVETMRVAFELLTRNEGSANTATAALGAPALGAGPLSLSGASQTVTNWTDFSLLPSFDTVSKYFYFTVYGGSATVDGITFKFFAPLPPALKAEGARK